MKTIFSKNYSKFSSLEQEALLHISPLQKFSSSEIIAFHFQLSNFISLDIPALIEKLFSFGLVTWYSPDLVIGLRQYFSFNPCFLLFLRKKTASMPKSFRLNIAKNHLQVQQNKTYSISQLCKPHFDTSLEKEAFKELIYFEYLDYVHTYLQQLKKGELETIYLELLGWFQIDTNEYDYFNYLVDKALTIGNPDNKKQIESFIWLLFSRAINESKVGNDTNAFHYISSALKLNSETNINEELYLKTINVKAIILRQLFQKTLDEKYFNDLVDCIEKINKFVPEEKNIELYNELKLSSKAELAFCYCANEETEKGLSIYYDILSKTKNEALKFVIIDNLGNIFRVNNYPKAKAYFLQSLSFYTQKKQFHDIGRTLLRLANLELSFKKISIQKIEIIAKKAMEIFITLNDEKRINLTKELLSSLDNQKTK